MGVIVTLGLSGPKLDQVRKAIEARFGKIRIVCAEDHPTSGAHASGDSVSLTANRTLTLSLGGKSYTGDVVRSVGATMEELFDLAGVPKKTGSSTGSSD